MTKQTKDKPDLIIEKWIDRTSRPFNLKSGVYAIYIHKDICLYVGATTNLAGRVVRAFKPEQAGNILLRIVLENYHRYPSFHRRHCPAFVKIFFHQPEDLRELEQLYIKKLHARLNTPILAKGLRHK